MENLSSLAFDVRQWRPTLGLWVQRVKKKIITLSLGEEYQRLERVSGPSRQAYANKHGWDYEVISEIPEPFRTRYPAASFGWICNLYKLLLPRLNAHYDLVAYMDCDTLVAAHAPCLSQHLDELPPAGFGAVQTVSFEDRQRLHPEWAVDYYAQLERQWGLALTIADRKKHINGGLLLFRPQAVLQAWDALLELDSPLNEENRLNVYEAQQGRCALLPPGWNLLWMYEKYKLGILKPQRNRWARLRNKLYNRFFGSRHERRRMQEALERCFMLHVAFEHRKIHWLAHPRDHAFVCAISS